LQIISLRLNCFRNYDTLKLNFANQINIFYGENAQGKTNILEAIFLCATGRSHRAAKDSDLIKLDAAGYFISTDIDRENRVTNIEMAYSRDEKRRVKINGKPINRMGDLMGKVNAVLFSPEDLMIIKEGPAERRRFIDITLCQLRPAYFYDLQQYIKVLHQRNSLLKSIQQNNSSQDTLEVWDNNLIKIGSKIIKARQEFVDKLNLIILQKHYGLTDNAEKLFIRYQPTFDIYGGEDIRTIRIEAIEQMFRNRLESVHRQEIIRAVTLVGPQRDDYEIMLNDANIKIYGSQGQQRTAVLSIKLSEIEIMKETTGESPILLLDDVLSELDKKRQEYLLKNLGNIQTFITSTDKKLISNKEFEQKSKYYYVKNGTVQEE